MKYNSWSPGYKWVCLYYYPEAGLLLLWGCRIRRLSHRWITHSSVWWGCLRCVPALGANMPITQTLVTRIFDRRRAILKGVMTPGAAQLLHTRAQPPCCCLYPWPWPSKAHVRSASAIKTQFVNACEQKFRFLTFLPKSKNVLNVFFSCFLL